MHFPPCNFPHRVSNRCAGMGVYNEHKSSSYCGSCPTPLESPETAPGPISIHRPLLRTCFSMRTSCLLWTERIKQAIPVASSPPRRYQPTHRKISSDIPLPIRHIIMPVMKARPESFVSISKHPRSSFPRRSPSECLRQVGIRTILSFEVVLFHQPIESVSILVTHSSIKT
jgi:hypothetical protein